nr:hypothetical protein [Candidatus Liberibacter asiaticus]
MNENALTLRGFIFSFSFDITISHFRNYRVHTFFKHEIYDPYTFTFCEWKIMALLCAKILIYLLKSSINEIGIHLKSY